VTYREPARRRSSKLWSAAALVCYVAAAACSGGSKSPTVPNVGGGPTTTETAGSPSGATSLLAKAQAYAQCMRGHGVPNFPDPVATPSGDFGFPSQAIDAKSPTFQSASQTCDALVPGGSGTTRKELTPAQQQQWLDWAKCIRAHGMPDFPDPTFSGEEVHIPEAVYQRGESISPQMRSAMDACNAQLPSAGGLGG
jgi:hypothetical protein